MLWLEDRPDGGSSSPVIHAILHDEQGPARCTAVGRHAFSDDLGRSWHYAASDAYNGTVVWREPVNGSGSISLYRRERPHMVIGQSGPLFLSNGVQEATAPDRSWTLVQPIQQAPPVGSTGHKLAACSFAPTRLRTNALVNPIGLQATPRFSWGLAPTTSPPKRNQSVSAYRIECSFFSDMADPLWDSGKVMGTDTLQVLHATH